VSRTHTIALLLAAVSSTALATEVHAVQRTHVSAAIGNDTNTASGCTSVAPCRTFQAAMGVTDVNGEVVVLDSGGYGAVKITQSVALIAPDGVYAGISVFPNADGITIDKPGINVVLRGLSINGQGGNSGIAMSAGDKLTVENCVISNLKGSGIFVTGGNTVRVTDTIIRDNSIDGIFLQNSVVGTMRGTISRSIISGHGRRGVFLQGFVAGTTTTADIADSILDGNVDGVFAFSAGANAVIKVSVSNSSVVSNKGVGLAASSFFGAVASLSASNNIVSNNRSGIEALSSGARVWASGNTVSDNADVGLRNGDGVFGSAGDNALRNNGNSQDTQGNVTFVGTK
jgi:Right handed beta helix region